MEGRVISEKEVDGVQDNEASQDSSKVSWQSRFIYISDRPHIWNGGAFSFKIRMIFKVTPSFVPYLLKSLSFSPQLFKPAIISLRF